MPPNEVYTNLKAHHTARHSPTARAAVTELRQTRSKEPLQHPGPHSAEGCSVHSVPQRRGPGGAPRRVPGGREEQSPGNAFCALGASASPRGSAPLSSQLHFPPRFPLSIFPGRIFQPHRGKHCFIIIIIILFLKKIEQVTFSALQFI